MRGKSIFFFVSNNSIIIDEVIAMCFSSVLTILLMHAEGRGKQNKSVRILWCHLPMHWIPHFFSVFFYLQHRIVPSLENTSPCRYLHEPYQLLEYYCLDEDLLFQAVTTLRMMKCIYRGAPPRELFLLEKNEIKENVTLILYLWTFTWNFRRRFTWISWSKPQT